MWLPKEKRISTLTSSNFCIWIALVKLRDDNLHISFQLLKTRRRRQLPNWPNSQKIVCGVGSAHNYSVAYFNWPFGKIQIILSILIVQMREKWLHKWKHIAIYKKNPQHECSTQFFLSKIYTSFSMLSCRGYLTTPLCSLQSRCVILSLPSLFPIAFHLIANLLWSYSVQPTNPTNRGVMSFHTSTRAHNQHLPTTVHLTQCVSWSTYLI